MVVDIKQIPSVEEVTFTDAKCSDWVEQQPVDRFCIAEVRNHLGQMCGVGMIADFYGFEWTSEEENYLAEKLVVQKTSNYFPVYSFDMIYQEHGPEAAKRFTVKWLRDRSL